jgi:hypothetical protein
MDRSVPIVKKVEAPVSVEEAEAEVESPAEEATQEETKTEE